MSVPQTSEKRATTDVVVELSRNQIPPFLPFELRDHVTPYNWENRVSILTRLAAQYCRPTFERVYLLVLMVLTFLVPIATYYVTLHVLSDRPGVDDYEAQVWYARFISFGVTVATSTVLSVPILVWKYVGKAKVTKNAEQWTKTDALSGETLATAPVWKASVPGLFGESIVLTITVPAQKSSFDADGYLPPYISAAEDAVPPYGDLKMARWSKDNKGGLKYGDIPIYTDDKANVA